MEYIITLLNSNGSGVTTSFPISKKEEALLYIKSLAQDQKTFSVIVK